MHDSWWKENETRLERTGMIISKDHQYNFGTVQLTLATLPYKVFNLYYSGWTKKLNEKVKEDVRVMGWEAEEVGSAEIGYFG